MKSTKRKSKKRTVAKKQSVEGMILEALLVAFCRAWDREMLLKCRRMIKKTGKLSVFTKKGKLKL